MRLAVFVALAGCGFSARIASGDAAITSDTDVPRSLAWIRTEHANQSNVATFFTLGPDVAAE